MKAFDRERVDTVIVEHEVFMPGFYVAEVIGEAIMPPRSCADGPYLTREAALAARARMLRGERHP